MSSVRTHWRNTASRAARRNRIAGDRTPARPCGGVRERFRISGKIGRRSAMYVERLRLTDFRNYAALDLSLPRGLVVFTGRNAQGKSNLLEAVMLAATSRSFRTNSEREAVRWGAPGHFARVDTTVARRAGPLHVEVIVSDVGPTAEGTPARPTAAADPALPTPPPAAFRKRVRVNGAPRRALDLLGLVTVVVFAPTDLDLVI